MTYNKLKVADLKKILTERGLSTKGLKAELVKRLEDYDLAKQNENTENVNESTENSNEKVPESNNDIPTNTATSKEPEKEPIIQDKTVINEKPIVTETPAMPEEIPVKNKIESEESKEETDKKEIKIPNESITKAESKDQQSITSEKIKPLESNEDEKTIINEESTKPISNEKEDKNSKTEEKKEIIQNEIKEDNNNKNNQDSNKEQDRNNKPQSIPNSNNYISKDENKSEIVPQINIAGTSYKEDTKDTTKKTKLNVVDANSKKRALNSDDSNDASSKRKKTDNSNKSSPVDKKPQDTILINNFVRPLVTRTVKELVSQYGEVKNFWMDTIKTHAYVTYTTVEAAEAAYNGINGIKFPEETGRILSVEFLSEEESKEKIKKEEEKKLGINITGVGGKSHTSAPIRGRYGSLMASSTAARIGLPIKTDSFGGRKSESPRTISASIAKVTSQSIKIIGKNKENTESKSIVKSPVYASLFVDKPVQSRVSSRYKRSKETTSSEVSFLHNDKGKESSSKKKPSMDDLFKKTKATPSIYYRPLTKEEADKKEKRENEERIRSRERLKERERESKRSRRY